MDNNTVDNNTVDNNTVDNNTVDNNTVDNNTVDNNTVGNNTVGNNVFDNDVFNNNVVYIDRENKNAADNNVEGSEVEDDDVVENDAKESVAKTPVCFVCDENGTKRCAGCKDALYCSLECQRADWTIHKLLCQAFTQLEPRPGPNYFRGILFPEDQPSPRFVWNKYYDRDDFTTIETNKYCTGDSGMGHMDFDRYRPLKRMLGYHIGIWHKDPFFHLPMTPSLAKQLGPKIGRWWRGPFLAHGYEHGEIDEDGYEEEEEIKPRDLATSALAPLLDFFRFRGSYHIIGYEFKWGEDDARREP